MDQTRVDQGNRSGDFNPSLESVRGIAAMAVGVFHCLAPVRIGGHLVYNQTIWQIHDGQTLIFRLASAVFSGAAAVSIFFVLSGFVLFLALQRGPKGILIRSMDFCARRALRIYPALAVNLLIMAACLGGLNQIPGFFPDWARLPVTWHTLKQNLLLLAPSINGASWTLQIEFAAVPIILVAYFGYLRFGVTALIVLTIISAAVLVIPAGPAPDDIFTFGFMFLAGMLGADIGRRRKDASTAIRPAGVLVALAAIFSARLIVGYDSRGAILVEGLSSAYLITALAFGRMRMVNRFLHAAPLRFCGRVSYSLYLYHPLALSVISFAIVYRIIPGGDAIRIPILAVLTVSAAILLGWVSYRFVERTFIKFSGPARKLTQSAGTFIASAGSRKRRN